MFHHGHFWFSRVTANIFLILLLHGKSLKAEYWEKNLLKVKLCFSKLAELSLAVLQWHCREEESSLL